MKTKTIAILALCIILTACVPTIKTTSQQSTTSELQSTEYRTGNQGLRITFAQNMPPTRLFDTDEFSAAIEIENLGAHNTKGIGDKIYLSGFDQTMITGLRTTGEPIPNLEGKGPYIQKGATDRVMFQGIPTMLSARGIDKYPIKLLATACYEYETTATPIICIDSNPYASNIQKACTPKNVGMSGGQGAPITVTNVELEPRPGITRLKIDIANNGGGEVFKPGLDTLQKCGPYATGINEFEELNQIELNEVSLPGYSIISSCKPLYQGRIRLINNKATIYCEINTQGQSTYSTPLTIKLRYGYRNIITKEIQLISAQ